MPRASLSTKHPAVVDLKSTARSLGELCEDEALDLVKLGKALELLVQHANAVVQASGRTSIRFQAAEHALDLRTTKSQLDQFLSTATDKDSLK